MGADIHIYGEVRRGPGSEWKSVDLEDMYFGRNYELFTALANVRGYNGRDPKGFPEGFIERREVDLDMDLNDFHSASYFSTEEFESIIVDGFEYVDQYIDAIDIIKKQTELENIDNILLDTKHKAEGRFIICFDS